MRILELRELSANSLRSFKEYLVERGAVPLCYCRPFLGWLGQADSRALHRRHADAARYHINMLGRLPDLPGGLPTLGDPAAVDEE